MILWNPEQITFRIKFLKICFYNKITWSMPQLFFLKNNLEITVKYVPFILTLELNTYSQFLLIFRFYYIVAFSSWFGSLSHDNIAKRTKL